MQQVGIYRYIATAALNQVITSKPAILLGVIAGADVANSTIEISDHISDGNGNIKVKLAGSTIMTSVGGYLKVNAVFNKGITVDIVNQTDITFVYKLQG